MIKKFGRKNEKENIGFNDNCRNNVSCLNSISIL